RSDSLDESFHVGETAGVPVVISHHKVSGVGNFGRTQETLPKIAAAMRRHEIGLDAYPYIASSTVLRTQRIEDALRVMISWSKPHPEQAGRDLADIARDWGVDIIGATERLQPAGAIYWMMDEADVRRVLAFDNTMIGSDGLPHDIHPHPRLWGTFPRVLGHYCREVGLFGLETAVRKMTGLPAARFGLAGRGVVRAGAWADLCVFDAETVIDRATFAEPTLPAAGIDHVFANGRLVWSEGKSTGERPGRALRRQRMQQEAQP
ncbi:MAG: amidohydrolase family protein, partial [Alphaproteobacteria bacterium]